LNFIANQNETLKKENDPLKSPLSSFQEAISCHKNRVFFRAGHPEMRGWIFLNYTKFAKKSPEKKNILIFFNKA